MNKFEPIIRPMFCKKCFAEHHPVLGDVFAEHIKNVLRVLQLDYNPPMKHIGITPHLISDANEKLDLIELTTYCTINGCGVETKWNKEKENFTVHLQRPTIYTLPINDWKALQRYIDSDYSLLNS